MSNTPDSGPNQAGDKQPTEPNPENGAPPGPDPAASPTAAEPTVDAGTRPIEPVPAVGQIAPGADADTRPIAQDPVAAPPTGQPAKQPKRRVGGNGWKVATAAAAAVGLASSGTVYLLMDRQVDDRQQQIDELTQQLAEAEEHGAGSLEDLLGGLLGGGESSEDLDELLGGLLGGDGELDDLLDGLLGGDTGLGDFDPVLLECLNPDGGLGLNLGDDSIPDADIDTQVKAIADLVGEERGLPASDDYATEFVSLEEVQRRAVKINEEELDAEDAEFATHTLAALGAVEPGTDLIDAQLDALDAGVGGFYNPETAELVIGSESMDGIGAFVTSHELVHAMADAEFGLPDTVEIAEKQGADAAYAALSALEGDASLYSQQFVSNHLPMDELLDLQSESAETSSSLAEMPYFINRNLQFPYIEGLTFSCHIFLDGGWDAVDETYENVPETSAQILFPERYRDGEGAVSVRQPSGPPGWEQLDSDTFGAADLLFLLEAPGGDTNAALADPLDRTAAWAGGQVTAWTQGDESAVAVVLADRGGATPLCETVTDFYAAFPDAAPTAADGGTTFEGSDQSAVVSCAGDEVALGIAPDLTTARAAID